MHKCRVCQSSLSSVFDLGDHVVSSFPESPDIELPTAPLHLMICEGCGLVQLSETYDQRALYSRYWYKSSTNPAMVSSLEDVVRDCLYWRPLSDGDTVLDIACNDGSLLRAFGDADINLVGIDPAANIIPSDISDSRFSFVNDFFSSEAYGDRDRAKLITSIAMFYDLEDPVQFCRDVHECLADDGIWTLQLSYTPLMLEQNAFDNICSEHIEYYTMKSLRRIFRDSGFKMINASLNDVNAGSIRVMLVKTEYELDHVPSYLRIVGQKNVRMLELLEEDSQSNTKAAWRNFSSEIERLRQETKTLLSELVASGNRVYGYGASTKGNTLLQYYGLDSSLITAIAERNPDKFGLYTGGSNIPIISEKELREAKPDYVLVLPWHFQQAILLREAKLLEVGTRFIFPLPDLEIV